MAQIEMPEWIRREFPLLNSVSVGSCSLHPRSSFDGQNAHVHMSLWEKNEDGTVKGDMCYFNLRTWADHAPSRTFLHEYAHLISPPRRTRTGRLSHHGPHWKGAFAQLLRLWYGEVHNPSKLRRTGNGMTGNSFIRSVPAVKSTGARVDVTQQLHS